MEDRHIYKRVINIRIDDSDYELLNKIRKESKVSASQMFRSSLLFYRAQYLKPQPPSI